MRCHLHGGSATYKNDMGDKQYEDYSSALDIFLNSFLAEIDLVPFFVTLICCLMLGIEIGILIGVCVDIIFVLYRTARPKILIDKVEVTQELFDDTIVSTMLILERFGSELY
jgi:MFS superfamily sulfate permease-like transporter